MTTPPPPVLKRARQARSLLADRHTPFVFDAWYVAALSGEVRPALLARTLLGKRVVLFRTPDGKPAALDDRCAHRSYPLSAGTLDGATVVCGYHGFRYDAQGACVEAPAIAACPANVGVRSYPLIERGGLVWIWPGEAAKADPELLPALPWTIEAGWSYFDGYFDLACNYVSLHENLLDLTHIEFLHANTLGRGSPGYAAAPFETEIKDGYYALSRCVQSTRLPAVFARTTGLGDIDTAARAVRSEFLSVGCQQVSATYYDGALPPGDRPEYTATTAHLPTPRDHDSTHYFLLHGWNFGHGDAELPRLMREGLVAAFEEDVKGLGLVQATLEALDQDDDFYELSIGTDAAAVAMRQWIKSRALAG